MADICEKHHVLKRTCHICELEEENLQMRSALKEIANPSMGKWVKYKEKHGDEISFQEFLKSIAKDALKQN